ncbi:Na+/proline symporter [Palleronia aestuarii]|uniref:Na+/proline symporter n=1 Tax=Palleronia aestuarii TaxID=568105 RepID=A0A2W7NT34_9RHOB|nr:sodium:solute symporter family protein [Palleronia aestuarii]PZX16476.1 Na+/proline symporter [Palleronia aestuarii]
MFSASQSLILAIMVILCAAALLCLSWYFHRQIRTSEDYNVAGRKTSLFPLICTLVGTAIGGSTLLGFMSAGFASGVGQIWLPGAITVTGIILLMFFVSRIRRWGERYDMVTLADFMVRRYGPAARLPTVISVISAYAAITGMQFVAVGTVLQLVFGLNLSVAIVITWAVLTLKTWLGGLMAVIWSDAILGALQTVGIFFLLGVVYIQAGGIDAMTASPELAENPGFLSIFGIGPAELFVYLMTIGGYQFVRQDLWQRFWAADSARTAYTGYVVAVIFTMLIGGAAVLIGTFARLGLDVSVENPDLVYYSVLQSTLPFALVVVMIVVLLATVISCADSFFIAGASSISNDILRPYLKVEDDARLLAYSRHAVIAMSVIALALALYAPNLVAIWILGSAMLVCGVVVPALAALLYDDLDPRFAVASMWLGLFSASVWQVLGQPFGIHPVFVGLPLACLMLPFMLRTANRTAVQPG